MIGRLRCRIGRWLLRPEANRIMRKYSVMAQQHRDAGDPRAAYCDYIFIGARYVAQGWPHREGTT